MSIVYRLATKADRGREGILEEKETDRKLDQIANLHHVGGKRRI
jgi:hypothetical protein